MTWFEKIIPSRIKTERRTRSVPEGLWMKCPACDSVLYRPEVERNLHVCPKCAHHLRIGARERLTRSVGRPSRLARDFTRLDGNKGALIGLHRVHQLQEVRPHVAFDVELDAPFQRLQIRGDLADVGLRDVPGIGTRMNRDAGSPRIDADVHGLEHRRNSASARISDCRDFVDVY